MRRLRGSYEKIILLCEAAGVAYPEQHPNAWTPNADPDLQWLLDQSTCNMIGHPEQLAATMPNPGAMVVQTVGSGVVDESLSGFGGHLSTAFQAPHIGDHFAKLANAGQDERHLFIPLHDSALPFSISQPRRTARRSRREQRARSRPCPSVAWRSAQVDFSDGVSGAVISRAEISGEARSEARALID
jgi:hypothetical protein